MRLSGTEQPLWDVTREHEDRFGQRTENTTKSGENQRKTEQTEENKSSGASGLSIGQ